MTTTGVVVVERGSSSEWRARSATTATAAAAVWDLQRQRQDRAIRARAIVVVAVVPVGRGSERCRRGREGGGGRRGPAAAAAAASLLREELLPERRRRDEPRQLRSEWGRRDRLSGSIVLVLVLVLIRGSGGCRTARIERKEIKIGPDVVRGRCCLGSRIWGLLLARRLVLLLLLLGLWRRRIRVPREQVRPERVHVDRCRRRRLLLLMLRQLGLGRLKHLLERIEPVLALLLTVLLMLVLLLVLVLVLVVLMPLLMQVPFRRPRILRLKRRHRRQDMTRIASKHRDAAAAPSSSSSTLSDARAIRNREVLMPVPLWLLLLARIRRQRRHHHHHHSSRSHHHHLLLLLPRRNAHHPNLSPPHPQRSQTSQRYILLLIGIAVLAIFTLRERQSERRPIDEDLFVPAEAEDSLHRPRL